MNINILNKVIQGISEQLPLVSSFYTLSPYESWNVKEVQYGSVSFVVTKVNTSETTTTYDAVLYYADRLTEDRSNRDAIHSDAATVIQTIVGALNTADEYFEVDYPVGITLFEQDFADNLAGGYTNLTISVKGMGECFEDDWSVPDIVATSAYYTKDEIAELFPLRSNLSKVAFSGSFNDLLDTPNIVTDIQYNNLVESVSEVKSKTSRLESEKLNTATFNKWVSDFNDGLSGATPLSEFKAFVEGQNTINMNLAVEMKNAVKSQYLDQQVANLKTLIDSKTSQQSFDNFVLNTNNRLNALQSNVSNGVSAAEFTNAISGINSKIAELVTKTTFDNTILGINNVIANLAVEMADKMDKDYFDGWKDGITNSINSKVSTQTFDTVIGNMYTKAETNELIDTKVDKVFDEYVKSDSIESIVSDIVNDTISDIVEDVTEAVRVEIDDIVSEELQNQLGDYVTADELQDVVSEQYEQFIGTDEFKDELRSVVEGSITELVGDIVTEAELASKNYASKYYVDNKFDAANTNLDTAVHDINTKFGNYYTKSQVDSKLSNVTVDLSDYPTRAEVASTYYTKSQVDAKDATISDIFKSYYAKSEIDAKLENVTVDMSAYYTKEQVDDIIDNIEVGGSADLSNYYTKSEVDAAIENVEVDLTDYPTKAEVSSTYYTKTEVDAIVGDIDSILNNVLYNK